MVFYHVIVNTKSKNAKGAEKRYSELDITDKDHLINSIVIPYLKDKKFMFDGAFLAQSDIDTLKIYKTTIDSTELHRQKRAERDAWNRSSDIVIVSIEDDTDDIYQYAEEITRQMMAETLSVIDDCNDRAQGEELICFDNKKVFIVHGHDDGMKNTVARFVERLGLEAVILHEQENKGLTIIEKFERSSAVGFAIVLYTPCDMGGKVGTEQKPRARQNVVLEHGYFIGKLGRERVLALHSDEVELPSDLQGILYTSYDASGSWKYALAKEMRAVGYKVDMNTI